MSEVTCICCYQESNMRNMDPEWIKRDVLVCSTCVDDPRPLHEINPDAFIDIRAPYEESYGPAYNYEVGYLEGLKEAHRLAMNQQNAALADFLRKRIEEQKKSVMEEMPDE